MIFHDSGNWWSSSLPELSLWMWTAFESRDPRKVLPTKYLSSMLPPSRPLKPLHPIFRTKSGACDLSDSCSLSNSRVVARGHTRFLSCTSHLYVFLRKQWSSMRGRLESEISINFQHLKCCIWDCLDSVWSVYSIICTEPHCIVIHGVRIAWMLWPLHETLFAVIFSAATVAWGRQRSVSMLTGSGWGVTRKFYSFAMWPIFLKWFCCQAQYFEWWPTVP